MRADDLGDIEPGYFLRAAGESDADWNQVHTRVIRQLMPAPAGMKGVESVPVKFIDGTERVFNPGDEVEIKITEHPDEVSPT
ncbi:hypothetical protein AAHS21_31420 [Mycobacterium sp. 050272]|uniref:hypothetical protein n=1 Tax=Mycobacterium sp. 050272 TaxID=3142488 RepID=UPI0031852465